MAGAIIDSTSQSWLTPPDILRAVREVLGPIDLDPCASTTGWTDPKIAYTGPRAWGGNGLDGLTEPWWGSGIKNFYVNPPYGRTEPHPEIMGGKATTIAMWLKKCSDATKMGTREGIALVPASVESKYWFQHVWGSAASVCFFRGRLRFWIKGEDRIPRRGKSCIVKPIAAIYYGPDPTRFIAVFSKLGHIVAT